MKTDVSLSRVSQRILSLRGARVILSHDLAALYEVEHGALIQAVKRNRARFPSDFLFQLSASEMNSLKSQFVISNGGRGGSRHRRYAFTEQGVAMLSSVLRSKRAVAVNIEIMRAFVQLRRWLISNKELAKTVAELRQLVDGKFKIVFEVLEQLTEPPRERKLIGFRAPKPPILRGTARPSPRAAPLPSR